MWLTRFKICNYIMLCKFLTWLLLNLFPEEKGFWRTNKGKELLQKYKYTTCMQYVIQGNTQMYSTSIYTYYKLLNLIEFKSTYSIWYFRNLEWAHFGIMYNVLPWISVIQLAWQALKYDYHLNRYVYRSINRYPSKILNKNITCKYLWKYSPLGIY